MQLEVLNYCKNLGCCDHCCARYLGLRDSGAYENLTTYLAKCNKSSNSTKDAQDMHKVQENDYTDSISDIIESSLTTTLQPKDVETDEKTSERNENIMSETDEVSSKSSCSKDGPEYDQEPFTKRRKLNKTCVTCLGILQPDNWPENYDLVQESFQKKKYVFDSFACALSVPLAIQLREQAILNLISEKFPNFVTKSVPLKDAWRLTFGNQLADHLNKKLDSGSMALLLVTLNMEYCDDLQEIEILRKLRPQDFKVFSRARRMMVACFEVNRRMVDDALKNICENDMLRSQDWTNIIGEVSNPARCVSVVTNRDPLYIGGRYIKLSRELPQTPWVLNGERMMESSVQEIIFKPIADLYELTPEEAEHKLKFISGGREDVDVRCLGDGRPFVIEMADPRRTLTDVELEEACKSISQDGVVLVKKLFYIDKQDLTKLKTCEETKTKTYEALCIKLPNVSQNQANGDCKTTITDDDIEKINSYTNITDDGSNDDGDKTRIVIDQKTPIRVLHRRPLLNRKRGLYELHAKSVPGHPELMVLKVRSQAGTYIKEWVHGDAGRTRPSLGTIVSGRFDILALDVTTVHMEWP